MSLSDPCLIRSRGPSGEPVLRLGMPLVDDYLEFLEGRCRPNTVLAAAYDLRVFFGLVTKPPDEVTPGDVLGFITAQRTGRSSEACSAAAGLIVRGAVRAAAPPRRRRRR
jgi:integrase/recombinase XerD